MICSANQLTSFYMMTTLGYNGLRIFFEHEEEEKDFYKPVRVRNFRSNNYIAYKCNGGRNKTLSVKEYPNKIRPYLKDIINNLKKLTRRKFN